MKQINYNKHIWEGWTVQHFIDELEPMFNLVMSGGSWMKPFTTKEEIRKWCKDNQPYYKHRISEVNQHFIRKWEERTKHNKFYQWVR